MNMDRDDFIQMEKIQKYQYLIDHIESSIFEKYFVTLYDFEIPELLTLLRANAIARNGGDNSYKRMIHYVLSRNILGHPEPEEEIIKTVKFIIEISPATLIEARTRILSKFL